MVLVAAFTLRAMKKTFFGDDRYSSCGCRRAACRSLPNGMTRSAVVAAHSGGEIGRQSADFRDPCGRTLSPTAPRSDHAGGGNDAVLATMNYLELLNNGASGAAFMAGQFGSLPKAGPGTIYKIERSTGDVRVFANVKRMALRTAVRAWAAWPSTQQAELSTPRISRRGIVHAFSSDGTDIAQFDHGTTARPLDKKSSVADDGSARISSLHFSTHSSRDLGLHPKGEKD